MREPDYESIRVAVEAERRRILSDEAVERAAKALWAEDMPKSPWQQAGEAWQDEYRRSAVVALVAAVEVQPEGDARG
jgi:hypothetical protein